MRVLKDNERKRINEQHQARIGKEPILVSIFQTNCMDTNKGAEGPSRPGDTTAVVFWLTKKRNTLQRRPIRRKLPGRPTKSKLPVSSQFG
jgi:hypothetical protein